MANTVQIKRGNNTSVNAHTGPSGELIYNLDTGRLHAQDGSTAGGNPHALISDVDLKANASVTVSAGAGLTGGGTLEANRTLALSSASIASLSLADTAVQTVNGKTGSSITLTKADVGLSNVDNTSDASKPISTATQTALNAKANSSVTVSAGTGLTGGGNLTANRSIALNAASIASLGKADTALQAPGGAAGQILAKNSATTNDVVWVSSEAATAVSYGPQTLTAAQQVQARQNIQADHAYDTIAIVTAASVPAFANAIRTNGYYASGDGGGALYKRVASEPSHAGKVQSADGTWWELADNLISPAQYGASPPGARLNSPVSRSLSPAYIDQHFGVEYSSSSSDGIHYGYTANIIRTGGNTLAVGAQLNAFHKNTDSNTAAVWGAALEAWTGDHNTAPSSGAILIGIEPAIIQQRHDSDLDKLGVDVVFKNRKDGGTVLHGAIGSNKFNRYAKAIQISSQPRSALGEYCGWKTGISFDENSLDMDVDGGAIGIDLFRVDGDRLDFGIRMGPNHAIGWQESARQIKMRWLSSADRIQIMDGSFERVGFATNTGALFINGVKVVGARQPLIPTPTPDGTSLKTAVDQIRDLLVAHGLMASA